MSKIIKFSFFLITFSCLFLQLPSLGAGQEITTLTSPKGIKAWLIEDHSNPIISLSLVFRGGSALDPEGQEGMATLASGLIDEGAGPLDSQAFQEELARYAIRLSFDAGRDHFSGSLQTLTKHREKAFELLRLSLTQARFDPEPVERIRSQLIANYHKRAESPHYAAWQRLGREMFGDHPYARLGDGDPDSLSAITNEDLIDFTKRQFARENLFIGVSGDITPGELKKLLDATFASLPKESGNGDIRTVTYPDVKPTIEIPWKSEQSIIVGAAPGISRDDPDYFAAILANRVLGGGSFNTRLFEEIREKRGLVYSVSTSVNSLDKGGLVQVSLATKNATAGQALDVLRAEWQKFYTEGVSDEELRDAKAYIIGSYPLRFTSTIRTAQTLAFLQFYNLSHTYLEERAGLIDKVTQSDIKNIAKRLFDPEKLLFVIVGRPEGLASEKQGATLE